MIHHISIPVRDVQHVAAVMSELTGWKARPFLAELGQTQLWTVKNDTKFAHPFHLHGFFFLPLDEKLQPIRPMAWKDTLDVPIDGTIRFLVVFDERPGMWMFHCHILDHADGGLMGHVHLSPAPTDAARKGDPTRRLDVR